jgi:D-arabinose 1-dehydrogenase-like Zn-dependent alcohol dehydrogenase
LRPAVWEKAAMSTRCAFIIVKPKRQDLEQLGRWLTEGLPVPIQSTIAINEVGAALQRQNSGEVRGRAVVDVAAGFGS